MNLPILAEAIRFSRLAAVLQAVGSVFPLEERGVHFPAHAGDSERFLQQRFGSELDARFNFDHLALPTGLVDGRVKQIRRRNLAGFTRAPRPAAWLHGFGNTVGVEKLFLVRAELDRKSVV